MRMVAVKRKYFSIRITQFLMRTVGFWSAETESDRRLLNAICIYALCAIGIALGVESLDFYYSWGNLYAITYTACSSMPVAVVLTKIFLFMQHRKEIIELIKYTEENFWYKEYNDFGKNVMDALDKKALLFVSSVAFFVGGTVFAYMLAPILENIGKNETDRVLPFKLWIDFPSTTTPYFEVFFTLQTLALIHSGICFSCFDIFVTMVCIHVAGQFRILRHDLEMIYQKHESEEVCEFPLESEKAYDEFKSCVVQHRSLFKYVQNVENLFSISTLCQILVSSVLLCVAGFQVCFVRGTMLKRMIFIANVAGCFSQLFMVTFNMNEVILESGAVGDAVYMCSWEAAPYSSHKKFRQGMINMIMRSKRPAYITAGGFFPVSLDTFTAVLSTAASYFTLLRKLQLEE